MSQVMWRAPDELVARVREVARRTNTSMNEFMTRVLDAATNPDVAGDEVTRIRERLARAGLLADVGVPRPPVDPAAFDAARTRAGRGSSLVDLVAADRE